MTQKSRHMHAESLTVKTRLKVKGRSTIGGKWVYALKEPAENGNIFKAGYVAKGYNQTEGINCHVTFMLTTNITSVQALMQITVQNDLIIR